MNYSQSKKPTGDLGKAMQFKQEGIEKAQRSTQDSIRVSGSATDATLLITAFYPHLADKLSELGMPKLTPSDGQTKEDAIKEVWEYWRKYFFEKRDINETFKELTEPF